jgi:siroheme synthase-like protein
VAEKRYYMACLDLEGRACLVVGGGPVGLEKAQGILDCGARVTVVAPDAVPELLALQVEWLARAYETADLDGRILVVAATSDAAVNRRVFADAEVRGLLCNVADVPDLCSFILPAVHRVDPIAVAVSTGGASPALAQRLRAEIAAVVRLEHAELARELRDLRPWAKERFPTYEERRDYFRRVVDDALAGGAGSAPATAPVDVPQEIA